MVSHERGTHAVIGAPHRRDRYRADYRICQLKSTRARETERGAERKVFVVETERCRERDRNTERWLLVVGERDDASEREI